MGKRIFYLSTHTAAMRGRDILTAAGIHAYVGRNTDLYAGEGCGYTLTVQASGERAEGLLRQYKVPVTRKEEVL